MSVSVQAIAKLYQRDPEKTRRRYSGPLLVWGSPTPGRAYDEYAPRLTADLGAPFSRVEVETEPGVAMPEERPLPGAVLFEVRKVGSGADEFADCVTIGRSVTNDIQLDDRSVSRFHAFLRLNYRHEWVVSDATSRNGTFVNGVRLEGRETLPLRTLDVLRVGNLQLRFFEAGAFWELADGRKVACPHFVPEGSAELRTP